MTADRCPAVQFSGWGIVRCSKPAGHPPAGPLGDVWHSGSGRCIDEDSGEPDVFAAAWRYMPTLA